MNFGKALVSEKSLKLSIICFVLVGMFLVKFAKQIPTWVAVSSVWISATWLAIAGNKHFSNRSHNDLP